MYVYVCVYVYDCVYLYVYVYVYSIGSIHYGEGGRKFILKQKNFFILLLFTVLKGFGF